MKQPVIYHNPRCSKSREALALLVSRGFTPQVIEYLKTPPTVSSLKSLLNMINLPVRDLLRKKESEYKALDLANSELSDEKILALVAKHPILLERPIVVFNNKAVIARPTEIILSIL